MILQLSNSRGFNRFKLPRRPFWKGFFHALGLEPNPYGQSVASILNKNVYTALRSDAEQLKMDADKAWKNIRWNCKGVKF